MNQSQQGLLEGDDAILVCLPTSVKRLSVNFKVKKTLKYIIIYLSLPCTHGNVKVSKLDI